MTTDDLARIRAVTKRYHDRETTLDQFNDELETLLDELETPSGPDDGKP